MMCWMGASLLEGGQGLSVELSKGLQALLSFNSYTAVDLTPQQLMFEPWALHTARQNQAKNLPTFQKTCFPARHGPIQWVHLLPLYQKSYCPDKSGLVACFVISAWFVSDSLQLCERARWQEAKERDPSLHRSPSPDHPGPAKPVGRSKTGRSIQSLPYVAATFCIQNFDLVGWPAFVCPCAERLQFRLAA